ncbi:MAG: ankyrin repeat domain-containing protein [Desulfobacteraceae bacterium]|nr:ankyrin repeat domain-containing protein [Desulfobacteraceae bacterium]
MGYKGKKLEEAVFRRDHKWVKKWIDAGANTYKKDDNGCSLIDWAALSGDSKTVDVLLSKSSFGLSSDTLSKAAGKGHTDVVKVLLSHPNSCNKIDVNEADYLGQTALSMAARKGRVDVVNALLSHTKINMDEDARRYLDRLVDTNDVYSIQEIVLNGCSKKVYDHLYTKAIEAGKEHLIERLSHLFTGYANTQALGGHNKAYSGSGNVPEGILDTVKEYLNSNLPKTQALQPR